MLEVVMNSKYKKIYQKIKGLFHDKRHFKATLKTFFVRKIIRRSFISRDRNGYKYIIFPQEHVYSLFYNGYLGFPEIAEQEFCKKTIKPGMTVFDIGANIGQFALLFASLVSSSGQVFAFEPCTSTIERLNKHILLNGFNNIVTERLAVYHTHGDHISINVFPGEYSVWNTMGNPVMFKRGSMTERCMPITQEKVLTVTLDQYCRDRGIQNIDYLKVDVEGAELDTLKGCSNLLERKAINYIQFEVSRDMMQGMGRDGSEVFEFLNSYGYICHPISQKGELLQPVTTTTEKFANFVAIYNREQ